MFFNIFDNYRVLSDEDRQKLSLLLIDKTIAINDLPYEYRISSPGDYISAVRGDGADEIRYQRDMATMLEDIHSLELKIHNLMELHDALKKLLPTEA